jgi:Cys-rich protein (TIGR01571 family)
MRVFRDFALLVFGLSWVTDAATFLSPRHASLVGQTLTHDQKDMPVTTHNKTAGDGYNPGSPLYKKQQKAAEDGDVKKATHAKAPNSIDGKTIHVTVPPKDKVTDPTHWWTMYYDYHTKNMTTAFVFFLQYFIFTMLVALIWVKCTSPGRTRRGYDERKNNAMSFAYGLFSLDHCCAHHSSVCLCTWCCAPLRLADTYSKEPFPLITKFWHALILITCLLGLSQLTFGVTELIFFGLAVYFRQQLRKQYGLEAGGSSWCTDCLAWLFCPFCAIAQEARQVEFVKKPNDPVK